jgi:hypothetical protein
MTPFLLHPDLPAKLLVFAMLLGVIIRLGTDRERRARTQASSAARRHRR